MNRPNILLLHTDQQRFDTIAALGAGHMQTPNIDRLVGMGTVFNRAYSSNPICMPARHDLITGATARYHGYYTNLGSPIQDYSLGTIPRFLTEAGYQTLAVGKMHFHPEREHHGFAHMFLMEELPSCRENDAYLQYLQEVGYGHVRCQHGVRPLFYHTPQRSLVPAEHHGSAWVATQTIDLIREERDRPWFLFASWVGPHPPYYMPEDYLEMYRGRELPDPCPMPETVPTQVPSSPGNVAGDRLRRIREAYFGAVSLIDAHVGRILDVLEETGQMENTVILFTADHGEMLGDREIYQKMVPYEGAARIPLIACGPGFERGRSETPVTTWDVAATILDAAGIKAPEDHPLAGESLRGLRDREARIVVYHHAPGRGRYVAAVGRGYKFVHWYNGGQEELYDLGADPWEQENLAEDGKVGISETGMLLRQACLDFERDRGIAENVRDGDFVDLEYMVPDAHRGTLYPRWSYQQFPRWMKGYSAEDLQAIADQMRRCLRDEELALLEDAEWREAALEAWLKIGGDANVYEEIFREAEGMV
ncbi:sulfatase-like hydrolase/transferase [bacterium]|nr:sulfatase-like hydrolase/transferase [bacterium]